MENNQIKKHYKVIFVLGADIEKDKNGNLNLADKDKYNLPLLSRWRLMAVKKLFEEKMAEKFVIIGGKEKRYPDENILRPQVMKNLLIKEYKILEALIDVKESNPSTLGNIVIIKEYIKDKKLNIKDCAFLTNFYHIPRTMLDFHNKGLFLRPLAAESFFIIEDYKIKSDYGCTEFNFFDRLIAELKGMKDKEFDEYK